MKTLKRLFSYLINPRSGTWFLSESEQEVQPRKVPWKGIFNPPFVLGSIILLLLIVVVWFGPKLASFDPYITSRSAVPYYDAENKQMITPPFGPSPLNPLGTDRFGNDILSLILFGARVTLISALYITGARILLGLILGGISGWKEGSRFDRMVMQLSVVINSIPLLLSSMLMILALDIQKGVWVFVVSLSALGWTEICQLVRGEFIRIKEMLYVEAAEALGLTRLQIVVRHAIPNVLSYLLSISFLEMGSILLILAELGFLGLFVGGGSRFMADPFQPVMIQLSEIPEWGALVAQGTPFIRSYPYMILGPAAAFFIAILGLNAFGEGLRRIFDRWPFSTAFILKKRMLLIIAAFIGVSAVIFQLTNSAVSYQQVADAFDETSAIARYEELKIYNSVARGGESNPVVDYIVTKLREYDIQPGWSETLTSFHYYPITTTLLKPAEEPRLLVGSRERYFYRNEFSYLTAGCAGSGQAEGQLVYLGGLAFDGQEELGGKIVIALEESTNDQTWAEAAKLGIEGILLVTSEAPPLQSQFEADQDPDDQACPAGSIPVFRIPQSVARQIMAQAGQDWDQVLARSTQETFLVNLGLTADLELQLKPPEVVDVPNLIGFIGGYDFDHADEIVVIYTTFDGLGLSELGQEQIPDEDLAKIAVLLEIMRTWKDKHLDPRRSVQFVIWGGEDVPGPFYKLLYSLFELNKLAAKVPTNTNPYINTNPVKPAIWVEIGELSAYPGDLAYSPQSTAYLRDLADQAAAAADIKIQPDQPRFQGVNSGLPNILLWEERQPTPTVPVDFENLVQKGVVINRTLIQLVRDMRD